MLKRLPPPSPLAMAFWHNTRLPAMLTPLPANQMRMCMAQRGRTLQAAWALHPNRFVQHPENPPRIPNTFDQPTRHQEFES